MGSEHCASGYTGQPGAVQTQVGKPVLASRRRIDPVRKIVASPLQATCSQVQYSTVGLSLIHNCLKTRAVPCCLCTHSGVLGLMLSAALPNSSLQQRWEIGICGKSSAAALHGSSLKCPYLWHRPYLAIQFGLVLLHFVSLLEVLP